MLADGNSDTPSGSDVSVACADLLVCARLATSGFSISQLPLQPKLAFSTLFYCHLYQFNLCLIRTDHSPARSIDRFGGKAPPRGVQINLIYLKLCNWPVNFAGSFRLRWIRQMCRINSDASAPSWLDLWAMLSSPSEAVINPKGQPVGAGSLRNRLREGDQRAARTTKATRIPPGGLIIQFKGIARRTGAHLLPIEAASPLQRGPRGLANNRT